MVHMLFLISVVVTSVAMLLMIGMLMVIEKVIEQQQWLCSLTVLLITCATAYFTKSYLSNPIVLWSVALMNGALCGSTSLYLARTFSVHYEMLSNKVAKADFDLAQLLTRLEDFDGRSNNLLHWTKRTVKTIYEKLAWLAIPA